MDQFIFSLLLIFSYPIKIWNWYLFRCNRVCVYGAHHWNEISWFSRDQKRRFKCTSDITRNEKQLKLPQKYQCSSIHTIYIYIRHVKWFFLLCVWKMPKQKECNKHDFWTSDEKNTRFAYIGNNNNSWTGFYALAFVKMFSMAVLWTVA